ncbi:MAG: HAD-IIIC family phosphatase [Candidatus Omnitrophota bacterium]|nr:HAD-IIIC family phosphatase [Candidatus Omnitrophota bacterium]
MNGQDKKEALRKVKEDIKRSEYKSAFSRLDLITSHDDDFVLQSRYAALFRSIRTEGLDLKKIRVAVLATSTVSHFNDILRYWLAKEGFDADIYESEYDTVRQTIMDKNSPLYDFGPDIAVIFTNYRDVAFDVPPGSSREEIKSAVSSAVRDVASLWDALNRNSKCHIIQNNADLPYHRTFGNFEGAAPWTKINVLRLFNLELASAAVPGVTIFDLDFVSSAYGKRKWHDAEYWYHSKHAFSLDATGLVAHDLSKVIGSIKGRAKKCLVLDLDNTIWGGVIGDDGIEGIALGSGPDGEAFADFQRYLALLKRRGVILAVCSKNDEETAKEPFLKHPDMHLKLEDMVVFKANWDDKPSNIRQIASELNIGLDAIVFVDDNPAERELVRSTLPMVSVPELPPDPAGYVHALTSHSYFETVSFSDEDRARTEYYKSNVTRLGFQKQFTDLADYLKSLGMEMAVWTFDDFNLPRISQLVNKSNQFHLTTTRYTEQELRSMRDDPKRICRSFRLRDRFGDNGLISAVILEKKTPGEAVIDTWVMSCRVLSRSCEEFICREMITLAEEAGVKRITGKYIPTKKNRLVSGLYERLGFRTAGQEAEAFLWSLDIGRGTTLPETFIKRAVETDSVRM